MVTHVLDQLRTRSPVIHVRWETLLRIERASGPLANPETLKRLIPDSIAAVLTKLATTPRQPLSLRAESSHRLPPCDCGQNPYTAYFVAGEQAFAEAIVLLQSEQPREQRHETDVAEVIRAVRALARDEIDTFCDICTRRGHAAPCLHMAGSQA